MKKIAASFLVMTLSYVASFGQVPSVTYKTPVICEVNKGITPLKPNVSKGAVTGFTITPELPDSLKLDTVTGIISGKPIKALKGKFTIYPKSSAGVVKPCTIEITVKAAEVEGKDPDHAKQPRKLNNGEWVLVWMPFILFIAFLFPFVLYLLLPVWGRAFSLKDALSESSYVQKTVVNPELTKARLDELIQVQKINTATTALPILTLLPPTLALTDDKYRPSMSRLIAFLTSMLSLAIGLCLSSFFIYYYLAYGSIPDISKLSTVLISMGIGVVPYVFNKVSSMAGNGPTKV